MLTVNENGSTSYVPGVVGNAVCAISLALINAAINGTLLAPSIYHTPYHCAENAILRVYSNSPVYRKDLIDLGSIPGPTQEIFC